MERNDRNGAKANAGRNLLGDLAPKFAQLNDDVLFGEVWAREEALSARDRSMITISALFSAGLYPQLKSHLEIGRAHGITKADSWFQHLALEVPGEGGRTEWCEAVDDGQYGKLS